MQRAPGALRLAQGADFPGPDLQGRCDSLTYDRQDSIIYLNRDPVLWQAHNQLTADSMEIRQQARQSGPDAAVRQLRLSSGQDTLLNFNQVKGRNMVAYFRRRPD
ncbi:MAG: hypothetical protein WKG07_36260 [Hymenobacter sp.]